MPGSYIEIPSGGSAYWDDSVANVASLPSGGRATGSVILVRDTLSLVYWDGASWTAFYPGPGTAVTGPGSSTDNRLARWSGTSGNAIDVGAATLSDAGALSGLTSVVTSAATIGGTTGPAKLTAGVVSTSAVSLTTEVTGTLPVGNGGTGLTGGTSGGIPAYTGAATITSSAALAQNGVLIGGGAGATPSATTAGAADTVLRVPGAGGAPAFGAVDLTKSAAVTGALPVANGGTNSASALTNGKVMRSAAGAIVESSVTDDGAGAVGVVTLNATTSAKVGASGTAATGSAFEVASTTGGLLLPRMTTAQRDGLAASPDGLCIFNTTLVKVQVRENGGWVSVTGWGS